MKKEKDAIKNSTKELTKTELVHKFQTAPLDLKFYGQVEEQHNQQILSRKKHNRGRSKHSKSQS